MNNLVACLSIITYGRHEAMRGAEEPIYSVSIFAYRGVVGLGVAVDDYMQVPW